MFSYIRKKWSINGWIHSHSLFNRLNRFTVFFFIVCEWQNPLLKTISKALIFIRSSLRLIYLYSFIHFFFHTIFVKPVFCLIKSQNTSIAIKKCIDIIIYAWLANIVVCSSFCFSLISSRVTSPIVLNAEDDWSIVVNLVFITADATYMEAIFWTRWLSSTYHFAFLLPISVFDSRCPPSPVHDASKV